MDVCVHACVRACVLICLSTITIKFLYSCTVSIFFMLNQGGWARMHISTAWGCSCGWVWASWGPLSILKQCSSQHTLHHSIPTFGSKPYCIHVWLVKMVFDTPAHFLFLVFLFIVCLWMLWIRIHISCVPCARVFIVIMLLLISLHIPCGLYFFIHSVLVDAMSKNTHLMCACMVQCRLTLGLWLASVVPPNKLK